MASLLINMKTKLSILIKILIILFSSPLISQNFSSNLNSSKIIYPFLLFNGPDLSTMKQTNENMLSADRIFSRLIDNDKRKLDDLFKMSFSILGLMVTHEEGHRSVLTDLNIGSISQPFSFFKGAAYVKGVTDQTLIHLRQNNFPDFIHLHTAGLEADYANSNTIESFIALHIDDYKNLKINYVAHKIAQLSYFLTVFIPKLSPSLQEEKNELERDIVGHDIFGYVRHLYRPDMLFYRYTNFDDLTKEEKKYARRVSFLALLNFASPMLFNKPNFRINDYTTFNASLGYTLAPFGGFIDENIWLNFNDRLKIQTYLRQFHNKKHWFLGAGIKLFNYYLLPDKLILNSGLHIWSQPEGLSFKASDGDFGFGGDITLGYKIYTFKNKKNDLYLNLGSSFKDYGFIPEYASLGKDVKVNFGCMFTW